MNDPRTIYFLQVWSPYIEKLIELGILRLEVGCNCHNCKAVQMVMGVKEP